MASGQTAPKSLTLKGNTLRVYFYVLRKGPCELREIQHALEMASPSLASYHLNKLIETNYVTQDESGRYLPLKEATSEFLAGYVKLGATIVPQSLFFSIMFSVLAAFFGVEALSNTAATPYLVAISFGAVAVLWYETFRLWRRLATWD